MISPSALVGGQQPKLLGVSPNVNSPAKTASPFQLDTTTNTPAATPAPAKLQADTVVGALASIAQVLTLLATKTTGTPLINANAAGSGPALLTNGGVPSTFNTTTDPSQKTRLDGTLAKVANDPEGSVLLQKAIAKGYTIEVGDPNAAGVAQADLDEEADAGGQVNGLTLPDKKKIIINPNAPDFDKTVVHELVHAASDGDGNSQQEEGFADVIGFRVYNRIDGVAPPGSEQSIFNAKIQSYPNLQATNGILDTLAQLGLKGFSA